VPVHETDLDVGSDYGDAAVRREESELVVPRLRRSPTMEYLVAMITHVPDATSEVTVRDMRKREAARSQELAVEGQLLRLWRPLLQPG
jgi:hypothetical protein